MEMLSTRLYSTSLSRSALSGSFASAQGMVSSMYLLHLRNRAKISVSASATRSASIHSVTLRAVPVTTAFRSSSTGSVDPVEATVPPKYLLDMDTVRLTRFPSVFARSELNLSIIRSQVITPSLSNGISCRTKYRTASTPNNPARSSA